MKNQLRTLSKENAVGVGQHLVMVAMLLDTDIVGAQAHAETAVRRAGRVPRRARRWAWWPTARATGPSR